MDGAATSQRRTHALRRTAVGVTLALLAAAAITIGGSTSSHDKANATTVPISTNPATVTTDVNKCGQIAGVTSCYYPNGFQILAPTVPIPAADVDAVNGMQQNADSVFRVLHPGVADRDPRITTESEDEIRGIMWSRIQGIIAETPGERSTADNQIYDWFQHVVQHFNLATAQNAQREYQNWVAMQCAFRPGAPDPAYNPGVGCNPTRSGTESLAEGAISPTFDQLNKWGRLRGGQWQHLAQGERPGPDQRSVEHAAGHRDGRQGPHHQPDHGVGHSRRHGGLERLGWPGGRLRRPGGGPGGVRGPDRGR